MLRLTLLLSAAMLGALYTLGEDRGQLRPGLALAASEGRLDEVWAEARTKAERTSAPAPVPVQTAALVPPPEPKPEPKPEPVAPVVTDIDPVVEVQPGREVVAVLEEPVFSLATYGNEPVPGENGTAIAAPAAAGPAEGSVWYVNANSVNVRAAPTTEAEVLGRLGNGEAALMVAAVDGDWARIVIEGDGLEGFVALRYLTPEAP